MAYTVKRGDTLWAIARANGMTLNELLALNPALKANPNLIRVGQEINTGQKAETIDSTAKAVTRTADVNLSPEKPRREQTASMSRFRPNEGGGVSKPVALAPEPRMSDVNQPGAPTESGVEFDIMTDPAYLAFLRAFDFQESEIVSTKEAQIERLAAALKQRLPEFDTQFRRGERRIRNNFAGRGMAFGSGVERDVTELRGDVDRERMKYETTITGQQKDLERSAAERIAELRRRKAEEQLGATERVLDRRLTSEYQF